jgi:hypothetical protein
MKPLFRCCTKYFIYVKFEKCITDFPAKNSMGLNPSQLVRVRRKFNTCRTEPQIIGVTVFVFRCFQVAWQFQNPINFPVVKQGLIQNREAGKSTHIWISSLSESHRWNVFYQKWRAEILQPGLEFDNLNINLKVVSPMAFLAEWLFLENDDWGLLTEVVKTYEIYVTITVVRKTRKSRCTSVTTP